MKIKADIKKLLHEYLYPKWKNKSSIEITAVRNELLTIVFWDISGFSTLAADLEAHKEQLVGFLHEYFEISTRIINRHEGCFDKFIGDGVMAFFGHYQSVRHSSIAAINAINAAIEFRKEFEILKNKWKVEISKRVADFDMSQLGLKCGINTGQVLYCELLIKRYSQNTVLGTEVNLANRLCDFIGKPDRIYISSSTEQNVRQKFELLSLGKQEIHNMKSHEVFEVINTFEENKVLPHIVKGSGTVTAIIPNVISTSRPSEVSAEFYGSIDLGFLTLKIEDELGKEMWFGDPRSVKTEHDRETGEIRDTGILNLRNERYSSKWIFNIQSELKTLKPGKALATLGIFETKDSKDRNGNYIQIRPHVDLFTQEILLIKN